MDIIKKIAVFFPTMEQILASEGITDFDFEDRYKFFYGLGTWIRNTLLYEGSELYESFIDYGIHHRDDQSYFMILLFYLYMKEKKKKF